MNNIHHILQELYQIDPGLREHEQALIPIIQEMLDARPDTKFDALFARRLKAQLMSKTQPRPVTHAASQSNMSASWLTTNIFAGAIGAVAVFILLVVGINALQDDGPITVVTQPDVKVASVTTFESDAEYEQYMQNSRNVAAEGDFGGGGVVTLEAAIPAGVQDQAISVSKSTPDRVSQTNVQVLGIDEPDIVKTNGQELFVRTDQRYHFSSAPTIELIEEDIARSSIIAPDRYGPTTQIIDITDPEDLAIIEDINTGGEMLLNNDTLVVFEGAEILGYDVSDVDDPDELWDIELQDSHIVTSRLYNDKIYVVTSTFTYQQHPCPFIPLEVNGRDLTVPCTTIYRPDVVVSDAAPYHAFIIDPATGEIEDSLTFVGAGHSTTVYMSSEHLYVTYSYQASEFEVAYQFVQAYPQTFPAHINDRIMALAALDISQQAKNVELNQILNNYFNTLDKDERLRVETNLNNVAQEFINNNMREFETTGIVQIDLGTLTIDQTGTVPGRLLNQFSLDEYNGNLRVATTVGEQWFGRIGRSTQSANDVYVLDDDLDIIGSVLDLGLTERIFAARFMGDTAYVVTFRQIDPFYVIDLSDPRNPQVKGELKIPGFSSYLHPLAQDLILGVGQEGRQVKLSLFDVSDPTDPTEIDKYLLQESWSHIGSTHRAFLQDADNQVFFIPGGQNAYIFSYDDDSIDLTRTVAEIRPQRAVYVDQTMFIIGLNGLVALDERDWEELDRIRLD